MPKSKSAGDTEVRRRILTEAFRLMAEQGEKAMSMRALADACDVNVAALYYYFDSKDDLLRSVIEERHYLPQLQQLERPAAKGRVGALTELIVATWDGAAAEEDVWRVLLSESLRNNATAIAQSTTILLQVEAAFRDVVTESFPLWKPSMRRAATTIVLNEMYAALLERLFRPPDDAPNPRQRAREIATLLVSAYEASGS
jgi:AcrR family transcriptional regulator